VRKHAVQNLLLELRATPAAPRNRTPAKRTMGVRLVIAHRSGDIGSPDKSPRPVSRLAIGKPFEGHAGLTKRSAKRNMTHRPRATLPRKRFGSADKTPKLVAY
jgi:hypothetical protein